MFKLKNWLKRCQTSPLYYRMVVTWPKNLPRMLFQLTKSTTQIPRPKEKSAQLKKVQKSFFVSNPQTQPSRAKDCLRRPPMELILRKTSTRNLPLIHAFTKPKLERPLILLKIEYLCPQVPNIRSESRTKIVFLRKPRATKNLPLQAINFLPLSRDSHWKGRSQDADWQNWAAQICPRWPRKIHLRKSLKNLLSFGLNPTQRWLLRQSKTNTVVFKTLPKLNRLLLKG